jgi:hypothetical protein
MLDRATRPFFVTFGVAFALFFSLPVIVSFKYPIIAGRYWLVGAPALTTLVSFAAWTWFLAGGRPTEKMNMRLVAACSALLLLGASSIHGFVAARSEVDGKMIWRGAKIVRPRSLPCWSRTCCCRQPPRKNVRLGVRLAIFENDWGIAFALRRCQITVDAEHLPGHDALSRSWMGGTYLGERRFQSSNRCGPFTVPKNSPTRSTSVATAPGLWF